MYSAPTRATAIRRIAPRPSPHDEVHDLAAKRLDALGVVAVRSARHRVVETARRKAPSLYQGRVLASPSLPACADRVPSWDPRRAYRARARAEAARGCRAHQLRPLFRALGPSTCSSRPSGSTSASGTRRGSSSSPLTFAIAIVSHRFFERPIRRAGFRLGTWHRRQPRWRPATMPVVSSTHASHRHASAGDAPRPRRRARSRRSRLMIVGDRLRTCLAGRSGGAQARRRWSCRGQRTAARWST